MTLGILPNLGDSFINYAKSGRDSHWENNYLRFYQKKFKKILFFSYANEPNPYPKDLIFLPNKLNLNRFVYTFLLPLLNFKQFRLCNVFRVKQMPGCLPAVLAKLLFAKPYLATYGYDYALFAKEDKKHLSVPLIKIIEYIGIFFADAVIVTNNQMQKKVCSIKQNEKVFLIPNGVDTRLFKPENKSKAEKVKTVLSVGRLVTQKNFQSLIKALAIVQNKFKVKLVIVGSGPLKKNLLNLALENKVSLEIIPARNYYEMPQVYNQADLFVLPSFYEGSPKVLLEAMSCALPCIVSDKEYARFVIENNKNGILVEPEAQLIAAKVSYLLENRETGVQIGNKARTTIIDRFNNKISINKELEILNKIKKC